MNKQRGFTIIEMVIAIVVLVTLTVFFVIQRGELESASRDNQRKVAVNSIYYALKNSYYQQKGYYPQVISRDALPMIDPTLFTDPKGNTLHNDKCNYTDRDGKQKSDGNCEYHYSASNCDNQGKCTEFVLVADMEQEASYRKSDKK